MNRHSALTFSQEMQKNSEHSLQIEEDLDLEN